jgi:hypothetical protein
LHPFRRDIGSSQQEVGGAFASPHSAVNVCDVCNGGSVCNADVCNFDVTGTSVTNAEDSSSGHSSIMDV